MIRVTAGADREPGGDERVFDLEFADQRQPDGMFAPAMFEHKFLRKAVDVRLNQANALACAVALAANRDDSQVFRTRHIHYSLRTIMVD